MRLRIAAARCESIRNACVRALCVVAMLQAIVPAACAREREAAVATPSIRVPLEAIPAGSVVDVAYRFAVAPDAPRFTEDYVVFVHARDEHGKQVWTDDHPPSTPTREWRGGMVVEYSRPTLVPRTTPPGPVTLEIGLYSPRTGSRLPLDAADAGRHAYRAASLRIGAPNPALDAIYMDGWYDREVTGDAAGSIWRWSQQEGRLWFRNPKRAAVLVLQIDASISGVPQPRRVDIRLGDTRVDSFELMPGRTEVHRTTIAAGAFGTDDIARVTVAVDRAIVPAEVPGSGNGDSRSLGVRLFDAYLEPVSG